MSASERGDPKAGPFVNLSEAYCNGLDTLAKGYEPALKGVGRWNLEIMGFMTRRARAWLEVPTRASECKTPQDLVRAQLQFWQTAAHDYSEAARRMTIAFGAFAPPAFGDVWGGKAGRAQRDYISFPEAKPETVEAPKRERRAA